MLKKSQTNRTCRKGIAAVISAVLVLCVLAGWLHYVHLPAEAITVKGVIEKVTPNKSGNIQCRVLLRTDEERSGRILFSLPIRADTRCFKKNGIVIYPVNAQKSLQPGHKLHAVVSAATVVDELEDDSGDIITTNLSEYCYRIIIEN